MRDKPRNSETYAGTYLRESIMRVQPESDSNIVGSSNPQSHRKHKRAQAISTSQDMAVQ